MFRSDWMQYTPHGVVILVAAALAFAGLVNNYNETEASYQVAQNKYQETKRVVPAGGVAQGKYTDPKSYRDEWRAERDLEAQSEMARTSWWMTFFTGAGLILLAGTLFEAMRATAAANDAAAAAQRGNETAREIGEAQVRAYVTPESTQFSLSGSCPVLHFKLINTGNSPAFDVEATVSARMSLSAPPDCDSAPENGHVTGIVGTLRSGQNTPEIDIHIGTTWLSDKEVKALPSAERLFFCGCLVVSFRDVFKTVRSERFDFMAHMKQPSEGKRASAVQTHKFRIMRRIELGHEKDRRQKL